LGAFHQQLEGGVKFRFFEREAFAGIAFALRSR